MRFRGLLLLSVLGAAGFDVTPTLLCAPPPGWHSASPTFSVQILLSHGPAMWAAGSAESIASSTDLGQHWEIKHTDPNGALLLSLVFVDEHFGYAAGTLGRVLFTEDGGDTWTVIHASDETILQVAFGDTQHGVIRTLSGLMSTPNGGLSWNPITPANEPDWATKFPFIVDMAALDKDHLAVRVAAGPARDGEYLWSADGGNTWSANYIGNSTITSLFVASGAYWSVGHSVLSHQSNRRDKFGFGYSAPMVFHSKNGIVWEHNPISWEACHWYDCGGCTAQGCFGGKSSMLELGEGKDKVNQRAMYKFPVHDGLSSEWAKVGDTICLLVHTGIQCASLQSVRELDVLDDAPSWQDRSIAAIGKIPKTDPQCIRCQLDSVYVSASASNGPADLTLNLSIDPAGNVADIDLQGKLPEDTADRILKQVDNWLFEPHLENGSPAATRLEYPTTILLLNPTQPANPTLPGSGSIIVLNPQQ